MGFFIVLLLFIGIPIAEIAVFIQVGDIIGLWPTIGTVILTAILGTALLRAQGLATIFKAQENMQRGVFPVQEAFDGICLVAAGALLLTPGFLTDSIGFLLFVPPLRHGLRAYLSRHVTMTTQMHGGFGPGPGPHPGQGPGRGPTDQDGVIDGEYEDITDEPDEKTKDAKAIEPDESQRRNPHSPWSGGEH